MSARQLAVFTIILPDPKDAEQNPNLGAVQANASSSYQLEEYINIQTLSADLKGIAPDAVQGLLYVPSLNSTDPCNALSDQYVPHNVTRRSNIPTSTYTAIALVPWFSMTCTESYLAAANNDAEFVHGIIFYQVNDTTTGIPMPVSNPIWSLNDGGKWKTTIRFPAYAVPGGIGRTLMRESSLYSGNVSTAPNPDSLTSPYGSGGEARLFTEIVVNEGPSLPSLWVFLIVVLAILLSIIVGSSLCMGYFQKRRRQDLRRRVENGEVDLETLGIKRMHVPQAELDKMPLYTYTNGQAPHTEVSSGTPLGAIPETNGTASSVDDSPEKAVVSEVDAAPNESKTESEAPTIIHRRPSAQHFSQTTCAICLDDFISESSTIRELPCHHIFHPECVDIFLRQHSSHCPVCKKSALPDGYCPTIITNAMVRREQLLRRIRERRAAGTHWTPPIRPSPQPRPSSRGPQAGARSRVASLREHLNNLRRNPNRVSTAPGNDDIESTATTRPAEPSTTPNSFQLGPLARLSTARRASVVAMRSEDDPRRRREMARQRAVAALNQQDVEREQDIQQEQERLPVWRRALTRVFPGMT